MPLILSHEELCAITGRRRYSAQAKALARLGISHRVRADGFPLVSRAYFERIMGADNNASTRKLTEPDWSPLNAA